MCSRAVCAAQHKDSARTSENAVQAKFSKTAPRKGQVRQRDELLLRGIMWKAREGGGVC